jgi:hypothetical protein
MKYIITQQAGRSVAGQKNTGVGTTIEATEGMAAAFVALGWLIPAEPVEADTDEGDGGAGEGGEGSPDAPENDGSGEPADNGGGETPAPVKRSQRLRIGQGRRNVVSRPCCNPLRTKARRRVSRRRG